MQQLVTPRTQRIVSRSSRDMERLVARYEKDVHDLKGSSRYGNLGPDYEKTYLKLSVNSLKLKLDSARHLIKLRLKDHREPERIGFAGFIKGLGANIDNFTDRFLTNAIRLIGTTGLVVAFQATMVFNGTVTMTEYIGEGIFGLAVITYLIARIRRLKLDEIYKSIDDYLTHCYRVATKKDEPDRVHEYFKEKFAPKLDELSLRCENMLDNSIFKKVANEVKD